MEPRGIEPLTSALRTQPTPVLNAANNGVTTPRRNTCTSTCTNDDESLSTTDNQGHVGDPNFAEAMLMIARLPLSDEERAEAVRRLLGNEK